ncbi:sugar isomerase [candidate division KSB1 bacterium]
MKLKKTERTGLINRREFLELTTAGVAGAGFAFKSSFFSDEKDEWDPYRPLIVTGKELKVQPILMYGISERKEENSWRSWGGIYTEQAASEEAERISKELMQLSADADFPIQILPLVKIKSVEEALKVRNKEYDTILLYGAKGKGDIFETCVSEKKDTIIFVRHSSGPFYRWYQALRDIYIENGEKEAEQYTPLNPGKAYIYDVVVDEYQDVLWRLRALYGVKNFIGSRIVALGGVVGKYCLEAPEYAKEKYKIEIIDVSYNDIEKRIKSARSDRNLVSKTEKWTEKYLSMPNTALMTDKKFVVNAFLLYSIFKDLMRENNAPAFTIRHCMKTIIPISKTTACLPLSLISDEGPMAFCESDFVIIPSGILLHHISGKPVFLHNSTFPHKGMVTCAHCTSPRRMDGKNYNPVKVMTHYESDFGAAPKVEIPEGQEVTFIDPEYCTGRWIGFKGTVKSNPFYQICRSQQDVEIQGDWKKLLKEVRDSHWMMAVGDYLKEIEYASRKIGISFENISSNYLI